MDAFGIFEGGGAKGLAHVGALRAAEEQHVRFLGVAGTSAGAIVAALVAAGYKADDLYCPDTRKGVLARDLLELFGREQWQQLLVFKQNLKSVLAIDHSKIKNLATVPIENSNLSSQSSAW